MIVLLCAVFVPTLTYSTDVPDVTRDTSMDGRICDSEVRVFYLQGESVEEEACTEECRGMADCVAYSGNWSEQWCIGCSEALGKVYNAGAVAFKKLGDNDDGGYYGSPHGLGNDSNDDFCNRQIREFPDSCNSDSFQQQCDQVCGDLIE